MSTQISKTEADVIRAFVNRARDRLKTHAGQQPFRSDQGNIVIGWLLGRIDAEELGRER